MRKRKTAGQPTRFSLSPLLLNVVEEKGEKPNREPCNDIPNDQSGKKGLEGEDILPAGDIHMQAVHHESRTNSGEKPDDRKTDDVDDTGPCYADFEKT